MKKKTIMLVAMFIASLTHAGVATSDDDVVFVKTVSKAEWLKQKKGDTSYDGSVNIPPLLGQEGVFIASLCASTSPNLAQSRVNAMAWLAGVSVPTDRTQNPTAWHAVPADGLQWFDMVSTSFKSWMGTTILTNTTTANEYGNRIVVHAFGKYPVSDYRCRIVSTITNIGTVEFPVATNTTSGLEIPFNANFIGINVGTNGNLESFYNPSIGTFVVGGDDTVYSNGELPSQVKYDWWYRFGATVSVNATDPSGFNSIKAQFVNGLESLSATLVKGGAEIGKLTVIEAQPKLLIRIYNPAAILVTIFGGQLWLPYQLESTTDLTGTPWAVYYDRALYSGQPVLVSNSDPVRFFRLITVMSP